MQAATDSSPSAVAAARRAARPARCCCRGPRGKNPVMPASSGTVVAVRGRGYSKRIVAGAVILRSSGSVSVMTPNAIARPMPMIV